jgi:hypothetical protein
MSEAEVAIPELKEVPAKGVEPILEKPTPAPEKIPANKLKISERNQIIADHKAGKVHPDFEVIITKVPDKFIVRQRKAKITSEQLEKLKPKKETVYIPEDEPVKKKAMIAKK